jgi:hypothetical protein
MPVLNPWVQRLLVALLGGTVSSSVIVASSKNRYAPKNRKKRRVRDDDEPAVKRPPRPPIALGTVAKADAAEGFVPSLTWTQWRAAVAARGRALVDGVFGKKGGVDDNGARIADEVVTADGKRSRPARTKSKKGAAQKGTGKRRRRRQQATLFDSAKESLRQVVKEEAKKAVDDTVEQSGLKGAVDTIKQASDKVGETAKDVAQKLKDALPPDADEKIQAGARTLFAGARKQASRLRDSIAGALEAVEADRQRERDAHEQRQQLDGVVIDMPPVEQNALPPVDDVPPPPFPTLDDVSAAAEAPDALVRHEPAEPPAPSVDVREGLGVDEVAAKVSDGVNKLASFLVGPGHPDYKPGRSRRVANGDVVEAKDPGSSSST